MTTVHRIPVKTPDPAPACPPPVSPWHVIWTEADATIAAELTQLAAQP